MAEKMTLCCTNHCKHWWIGCFVLVVFLFSLVCVYRETLENYYWGIRSVTSREEFSVLAKKNRCLDFEFIAGCYFATPGSELKWSLRWGHNLTFFYDEKFVYALPNFVGETGRVAKRYGVMIDRETGMVYNRISKRLEAVGYVEKPIGEIRSELKGKDLDGVLVFMGKPVAFNFFTDGQLRLDYETKDGYFWIYLEKGVFLKIEFMDIVRL